MLALSAPLRTSNADDDDSRAGDSAGGFSDVFLEDEEVDFLDSIDFSGIFDGFGLDGNISVLPELQVACGILGDFSAGGAPEEQAKEKDVMTDQTRAPSPVRSRGRKPEAKSSHGKKKGKVDWTPELHRRFEKAVEQLGVDKAVPSRILELMGINNLTRHNVASHLQKYRSHRKHLLAREAEAASWSHRRQVSSVTTKKEKSSSSWLSPTIGFPPPPLRPSFRPLHVWGHPTVDHRPPVVPSMWPGNATLLNSPAHHWPPQPTNYFTYWQPHNYQEGSREGWGPIAPPCLPQPLTAIRFAPSPVTGVPPHQMYRPLHWVPPLKKHPGLQPDQLSSYPSVCANSSLAWAKSLFSPCNRSIAQEHGGGPEIVDWTTRRGKTIKREKMWFGNGEIIPCVERTQSCVRSTNGRRERRGARAMRAPVQRRSWAMIYMEK